MNTTPRFKAKAPPQSDPPDTGDADANPQALSSLSLAGWGWMLELGIAMTALSLQLLQAQRAALGLAAPLAPAGASLTIGDIYQRVMAAGYREIREIEWEDEHYEVEAHDADGNAVELLVNGHSGAIESVQLDG